MLAGALLLILQRGIASGGLDCGPLDDLAGVAPPALAAPVLGYGADTLELYFPSVYPPQLVYYQGRGVSGRPRPQLAARLVAQLWHCGNYRLPGSRDAHFVGGLEAIGNTQNAIASQSGGKAHENHWLAACMAGICAQLVGNLFLFEVAATAVVFWLLLAIVVAATTTDNTQRTRPAAAHAAAQRHDCGQRRFCGLGGLAGQRTSAAGRFAQLARHKALNQGNPAAALAEYETAIKHQPQRAAYHVAAALTAAQLGRFCARLSRRCRRLSRCVRLIPSCTRSLPQSMRVRQLKHLKNLRWLTGPMSRPSRWRRQSP